VSICLYTLHQRLPAGGLRVPDISLRAAASASYAPIVRTRVPGITAGYGVAAAAGITVVLWASAFVSIRSAGARFSPGAMPLGRPRPARPAAPAFAATYRSLIPDVRLPEPAVSAGPAGTPRPPRAPTGTPPAPPSRRLFHDREDLVTAGGNQVFAKFRAYALPSGRDSGLPDDPGHSGSRGARGPPREGGRKICGTGLNPPPCAYRIPAYPGNRTPSVPRTSGLKSSPPRQGRLQEPGARPDGHQGLNICSCRIHPPDFRDHETPAGGRAVSIHGVS